MEDNPDGDNLSSPPSNKIEAAYPAEESEKDASALQKPNNDVDNKVIVNTEIKKHLTDDAIDPVPCKKLKQDDNVINKPVTEVVTNPVSKTPSVPAKQATNKPELAIKDSKTEKESNPSQADSKTNESKHAVRSPEIKNADPKSSPKVLKKLPGLNPIRSLGAPLQVNTNVGGAPLSQASRSPVSPNVRSLSPASARPLPSPTNQMGGITGPSPTNQKGGITASITPVRNKSPIAQLQKVGGFSVSPVRQKSPQGMPMGPGVSISPVKQSREVVMSPFLSGEVTLSALSHQGLSITPVQPQLSPEIRCQIPEGISITAIPSAKSPISTQLKAKSPVGQHMPRQPHKSPPKAFGQMRTLGPLSQQMRNPTPRQVGRNVLPEPGMLGKMVRTPRTPGPRILDSKPLPRILDAKPGPRILDTKPAPRILDKPAPRILDKPAPIILDNKLTPRIVDKPAPKILVNKPVPQVPSEQLKSLLSQKPLETPLSQFGFITNVSPVEKGKEEAGLNVVQSKAKTPELAVEETQKKEDTMDMPIEEKKDSGDEEDAAKKEVEADDNKDTDDGDESGSESDSEESADEKEDTKDVKRPRGRPKKGSVPAANLITASSTKALSRGLRTRTQPKIETNVAVKLDRIDDDLEDGALPAWSVKKLNKSAVNSDVDAESGDASDDNSNSQGSKMSSTAAEEAGGPKKRGRPRKTFSPVRDIEDYTSHDSLHEALKKIIADEGLEPADSDWEDEDEKEEPEGRKETKMLLAAIPFFSRRGGRGGVKGKAIGKNNQFDDRIVDRLEHDRRFRTEMLKLYQEDLKRREEKKMEKIAENEKKKDERTKAAQERKEKLRLKAEERRRKYEEQKKAKVEEAKKREEARKARDSLNSVQNFDDDTRMSFPPTPGTPAWKNTSVKFESLEDGDKSESKSKRSKMEIIDFDSQKEFPVIGLAEYQWPLQGGEHFMIQEQVAAYLGVKSFKRKYPDLKRRGLEPEERTYICDSGLVSEAMIELGLTAVQSADIMDIMFVDFPEKYEEVKKFSREKQARELIDRQRAFYDTTISEQTSKDLKETLVEATALWNAQFNKLRRETRQCALDLQTFVVHYPMKPNPKPAPKMGHYPVAVLPGQYCDYYKEYTAAELKYMPLNTVLYGPLLPNEPYPDELSYSDQSDSDSDSGSSSSGSSSDSSSSDSSSSSSSEDEDTPKPLPQTPRPAQAKKGPQGTKGSDLNPGKTEKSNGAADSQGKQAIDTTQGNKPVEGSNVGNEANDNGASSEGNNVSGGVVSMETDEEVKKEELMDVDESKGGDTSRNCKACNQDESVGELIHCGKCVRYLHPTCLDLPLEMLPHMRMYEWQCSDCKSCVSCSQAKDDDKMLFCDLCDRGYHNYCIGLDQIPTGRWHCKVCSVCSVCKSTEPNPEWEHEMKKGPKGQSVYQRTLCTPCSKSKQR